MSPLAPAELLLDEQSKDASGLRERKSKVKAHRAMRERSSMPTFGCHGGRDRKVDFSNQT